MSAKREILIRVGVMYVLMLILGIGIVVRIAWLQFVDADKWVALARERSLKIFEVTPSRGDILDCNGRLLCISVPYYEIRVDMSSVKSAEFKAGIDSLAFCLSKHFRDKSESAYRSELRTARSEKNRYYLLKRKVSFNDLKALKKFPIFRKGRNKGGFIYVESDERYWPHGDLARRTIGYISKSEQGTVVGLEGAYDYVLSGEQGSQLMQRLSGGIWMPVDGGEQREPRDGNDVVTTLDVAIQDVAHAAMYEQLQRQGAHHGCAVLMEVETGDIKAMVNLETDGNGGYRESFNYAIGELTEPGSTFKLPVLMAAFEDGFISLSDTIDTGNGSVTYFDKTIRDTKEDGYGKITVKQVFENSSNVGCAKIVTQYYKGKETRFIDRIYNFGLNEKVGIDIKGEVKPDIKYPGDKFWSGISLQMMSFGYELLMTPLQTLTFYNAVANDGKMVRPRLVRELRNHGEVVKKYDTEVINPSICSSSAIRMAKQMLEGVVENGTAKNMSNLNYKIAGKTGTAQIAKLSGRGYKQGGVSYQASFVGYFPAENPKYSCIVVVNAPSNGVYYGNVVAGSVFKNIADKVYALDMAMHSEVFEGKRKLRAEAPYVKEGNWADLSNALQELGIPYDDQRSRKTEWVTTEQDSSRILIYQRKVVDNLVPNVVGMGAKDALFLLENAGLRVIMVGYGRVSRQSILPGNRVRKGDRIVLKMGYS